MLKLIGLGLAEDDITARGLRALESSDEAYAEFYTNVKNVDLDRLEQESGTPVRELDREEVEQDQLPVERAVERDVALMVSGDPLAATTHFQLKSEAERRGIDVEVYHAPSILTAVSETGLNLYRFGRTVTLPEDSRPDSVVEQVEANDSVGLHTLVLLDIGMEASEAAGRLCSMEPGWEEREAVAVERAGSGETRIQVGELGELQHRDGGSPPHSLVLTGEKSHKEEEFLEGHR